MSTVNAHIESFHSILENECLSKQEFMSYQEARLSFTRNLARPIFKGPLMNCRGFNVIINYLYEIYFFTQWL